VDIEGAGELMTKITYTGVYELTGTLKGASHAELRFLTVENIGGSKGPARAILNDNSTSFRLTHVTATAQGGDENYGVYIKGSEGEVFLLTTMTNVTVIVTDFGSSANYGVFNSYDSLMMTEVTVIASGTGDANYGVYNTHSKSVIRNSVIYGGAYGIFNENSGADVHNSQIAGPKDDAIHNDENSNTARVGASQLFGGVSGSVVCAGVYDEFFTFYADTCP
jgi:hypothetical protein